MFGTIGRAFGVIIKPLQAIADIDAVEDIAPMLSSLNIDVQDLIDACNEFYSYASEGDDNGVFDLFREEVPGGEAAVVLLQSVLPDAESSDELKEAE